MIKKLSSPPMIIILDILFLFLFIFIMNPTPHIQIIPPKSIWLKDFVLVSMKNNKTTHWYDFKTKSWKTIKEFAKIYNLINPKQHKRIFGNIPCNLNETCKKVPNYLDEEKRIFIKEGELYKEITGLIADSCMLNGRKCINVIYTITDKGNVDRERLLKEYPIFKKIIYKKSK